MPGTAVEDDGASEVQPNGSDQPRHVGHPSEVVLPDNNALPAQWEVVDADQVTATLKEGKNQPRDRSRAASNVQIQGIANMPDYRRLADSPVMDVGAPTLSQDGAIVGGNGRFEGVSRAYDQGTAAEYRTRLEADAAAKGIDPVTFSSMSKPVLVRRITQPFDTRALAVASNSGGSLQYSALEQAKIDGDRMNGLGDIEVNDTGDVVMSGTNMANVRRALTGYNAAELGSMTDKDGLLSQEGIRRIKNALLYKAYGNSSVLSRLVESADPDLKSVMGALVRSAGSVASVRADMKGGNKPADADIAEDLLSGVELLSKIKAQGSSVEQYMAQDAMFGKEYTEETAAITRYLSDNIRSQKRMAEYIKSYYDGIANEDHLTGSMFETAPASKKERLDHAARQAAAGSATEQRPTERGRETTTPVVHAQDQHQSENAQRATVRDGAVQQDTGVTGDGTKAAPITVEHHDHIKQAEQRVNTNPTDAQKKNGNYAMGHVVWNGLDITIENPQGSIRSGKDADGKAWEVTMPATYGYIKRTEGADGDHIDVYLGKHLQNQTVYVIDQIDHKTGKFDEHKNMLGFATLREAERIYKLGFSDGKGKHRLGATTPMTLEKFKEWIKTGDTTKPVTESLLTSYTRSDIAKREQQDTTAEDQAAVDRAVEHSRNQPLSLSTQTQERSEGKTAQAGMFTPDGRATVAAEQSAKAKADADIQDALNDLGAIMRDLVGVQRIMPEDQQKLLPVLVRLFDAAFRKGYYDIREATRFVRNLLAESDATKAAAKFLPVSLMDQAAKEAAAKMPEGFFENQGLFNQAAPKQEANKESEHVQDRMTNADKKSDSRNFKLPALHEFVPADVLQRAHDLIAKAPKAKGPTISAEDRAAAEAALKPLLAKAEKNKPEFDRMVVEIAKEAGIGQMLADVKGADRAAEKLVLDYSESDMFGKKTFNPDNLRDLLRATIVVKSEADVGKAVTAIRSIFTLDKDAKNGGLKNRFEKPDSSGYRDVLLNIILKDGAKAEIQINIPEMLAAKEVGHKLYNLSRNPSIGQTILIEAISTQKDLYGAAYLHPVSTQNSLNAASDIGKEKLVGQAPRLLTDPSLNIKQAPSLDGKEKNAHGSSWTSQKDVPSGNLPGNSETGNLSGNFISGSSNHTIAKNASEVHNANTGSGENTTQGAQHENRSAGAGSNEGKSATTAGATQGKRKSGSVHPDFSGRHIVRNNHPVIADSDQARVQRPGQDAAGAGGDTQRGDTAGAGDRAGGVAGLPAGQPGAGAVGVVDGRAGRAVPAGRDIPAKTGGNYHFTEADLNYRGSWFTKAKQNVEAVELVKRLDKEGRKATRAEQAILAKFIGWGASEIRNNIFDAKLDAQLETLAKYDEAIASLGNKAYLTNSNYREYHPAFLVLQAKNPALNWYTAGNITKAMLDAAKPDKSVSDWGKLRDRLQAVMSDEDWKTAERSTQYAHYTGKEVVTEILRAADLLGFKGGSILEPGAGIGVFPGLMNSAMANNSIYTGIEFDALTGAILKHLQPDERILVESFIDSALPDNFYDVAIGNPPFSDSKVLSDPRYKKHAFALHDYFFAKTMDKVKPGGLVMFVTSRYTMDKQGDKARQYLAERADLLGAIRLPETAFKKNAGTEVVTDILFLRKKVPGETFEGHGWMGLEKIKVKGGDHLINEYFAKHPEMVLGEGAIDRNGMYAQNQYTVLPNKDIPITELLAKAVDRLPRDVFRPAEESSAKAAQVRQLDFNPKAKKEGNYYVSDDGKLMQVENRLGVPAKVKGIDAPLVRSFVRLRDALNQTQYDQLNDGDWETSLKALQKEYKSFVRVHGNLLQNTVVERKVVVEDEDGNEVEDIISSRRFKLIPKLNDDPEYSKVLALETINDDTGEIKESDFLTKRTLDQRKESKISTPHDALLSSLNDLGRVDIPLIAQRIGLSEMETINSLGSAIYESPSDGWQMADEYLSGNVKAKLKEAEAAAKTDRGFARNVEALMNAQPSPVPPSDITTSLGMNWIPGEVYAQFLHEKTGVKANISYNEHTGNWNVSVISGNKTNRATVDWGTADRDAADIMEAGLTGRTIRITAKDPDTKATVFQPAATEAAIQKLKEMRQAFSDWMWQDNERTEKLVTLYNDKFNTTVSRKFDGRHLTLPGTTTTISVFDHVKRGAWRIIQSGNTYLAHAVGSGKTWEMVISAMEQKRLGMISKPMMVVPNHMLQQFAQEWLQLYPSARLMVADEKQFHTDNRRRFIARVGMSDLDGVIITHSAFKLLDLDPEFKDKMMNEQLDYYRAALEEVQDAEGDTGDAKKSRSPKVRDIQNRIEKLEEKLKATMSGEGKDKNVRFDEMGVDMLYVDEAHEYRKLEFSTVRQVKGISSTGSDRAFDLYMKTRWLEEKKPGRSLVLASGTPVTNTMAEMYSVQRFMQPKVLEEKGLQTFDAWASMFGEESTEIEADASGKYAPVTRFANIVNVPELTQMFREFADVLTSEHLAEMLGDKRPSVKYGARKLVITPQVDDYLDYKKELAARLEKSRKWKPSRDEPNNPDPVIRIIGDGRLAAIDMRFIDPSLPSDPASKLNVMADGVIKSYKKGADYTFKNKAGKEEEAKGTTQMVFSDIGFGAGVAANRGFNARAWFEKRLRDAGIPPNQVVFMSDLKKSDAKQKAFKDMNSGRVRILVGSSKNMGTGVNAQQRLRALHHLDTPWYPADLEQREGRIVRQGNKNRNVRIFAYSTKGSYDTNMWQLLARKQRFIDQALSGDSSVRRLEDISETSQFQMATAMTAGDERAIRLAGLKSDIDRYQRLYRSHEETRMRLAQEIVRARYAIEVAERKLPGAEKMAGKVQDLSGDKFAAKAGKTTYAKRKEWGEALLAKLKTYADTAKEGVEVIGEASGMPIEIIGKIDRNNDGKVLGYYVRLEMKLGEDGVIIGRDPNDDAVGLSMRATNALAGVERKPEELRKTIFDAKSQISANESRTGAKFQFAQEMADKIKEAKELEAEMERDGKDHSNSELVQKAKAFAEKHHGEIDQRRKFTNEPYIMHPQGVVDILRTVPHTEEMLAAAWAHDMVEDTKATLDDVRAELGDKVADLVEQLTKPYDISKMTPDAQTIKLADITHNALAAKDAPADFTRRYLPKKTAELELLKGGNQELWGKAKQAIEGDGAPLASVANKAQSDSYEVQPDTARNLPIDGATLVELRRAAAGIESAERGITFTVNADGKAIVTGPARVKVPARFQRFANEHGLTLVVKRADSKGGFTNANTPMPLANREAGALYFGEMGENHIDRTGKTRFSKAEQANPTPQTVESIRQATAKLRASWHDFKRVIIVQSVKEIPTELYLRALRAAKPIDQHSEGIYDPKTYTVYLVADNIASPERAVWVAIHEVVGHGGIRMLGSPVVDALIHAAKNGFVTKLAHAIASDRGEIFDARTHTDEAIAELAAATITGNVDAILERYGVNVPIGMRSNLLGMIRRVVDAVRQFIGRVTSRPIEEVSDGEVLGLIRRMKDTVEGKAQGYDTAGVSQGALASKSGKQAAQRAQAFAGDVLADFRNDMPLKRHADYKAAKGGDIAAAVRLVSDLVKPESIAAAKAKFGDDVAYLPVMALEASGKNQIPNALAIHYAAKAGGTLATSVFQTNKAFHTGADAMERMIARSEFGGEVISGQKYVLVDDVTTMGGTLADMASYIQSRGGVVSGAVLLTNASRSGSITTDAKVIRSLEERHGQAIRELFGIEPGALTRDEAQYLIGFRSTDELRTRAATASAERGRRIRSKDVSEPSDSQALDQSGGTPLASRAPAQSPIPGTAQPPAQPPRQNNPGLAGGQAGSRASWDSPEPSMFDDLVYKLQDKHIDMKRVLQSIKSTGATIANDLNSYLQEELFHGRAAKRTHDFVNAELRPMVVEMAARGLEMEELDAYLHARHAKEANALIAQRDPNMPDGGSGMTNREADDYFANLPELKRKQLEATAKRVDAMIARTREYYVAYGLVSKNQADEWAAMFDHYVPLMREDHDGGMGIGQGFSIKGKEVKHRTGSTAAVVGIFANIAMQREKAIVRGEKNRVAASLFGLAYLNPNPDFWTAGTIPTERVLNEKTGLVETRVDPMFKSRNNVVVAKIKDKSGNIQERAVIFNEQDERAVRMAEALKNLDATQLGGLLGVSAVVTRYFASINTQYNPVFGVTNLVRDVQGAALNLTSTPLAKHKAEVMKNILSAAKGIYLDARAERKGNPAASKWAQLWEELQNEGGMTGYRDMYRNSADRAKAIEHELDPHNWVNGKWGKVFTANGMLKVPLTTAQDVASPLFDWLSDYNLMMEGSTRLAIYKTAIDHGLSKQAAASLAKNTTVNFNRKGQSGQQAGALYAFFNAAMQGTARIGETVFDMQNGDIKTLRLSGTGKKIVYGGILLGSMQALALAFAGFDDDEPPEFIRERNLVIPIGGKKYVSIPMPLGFHALPNIGRITTEYAMGGFKKPVDHVVRLLSVFAEAFNPLGSAGFSTQTILPTAFDPLGALDANKDWVGKTIYKEDFNSLAPTPGFTRNKDTASVWSKFIAEGVNYATGGTDYTPGAFSPTADQIDYLIGQATGGVGRELSKGAQTVAALYTGDDLPTHKIPLVGRFYGDMENQSSQSNRYYSNLKELNLLEAEWKGRNQDGLPTEEFEKENPEYELIGMANGTENQIRELRRRKAMLVKDGESREDIREIDDRITEAMRNLNDEVRALRATAAP